MSERAQAAISTFLHGMAMTNNGTPAIDVVGLRKSYGDLRVLDDVDLQVAKGTVFALLGPNGAGKTTTVQILSTLIEADGGSVRILGHDVVRQADAVRKVIGVTGQFSAVDNLLTGEENLLLMADLNHLERGEGRRRAAALLDRFDLVEAAGKPPSTYSGGMQRKLDLAMTLVGDPRVIFLDEPTAGLDPRTRRTMWEIIRGLVADGVTIFLTTQYLEEADRLADRIALLDHGGLVAEGTPDELKRLIPGGHIRLQFADPAELDAAAHVFADSTRDDDALAPAGTQRRWRRLAAGRARPLGRSSDRRRRPQRLHARLGRRLPRPDRAACRGPERHEQREAKGDCTMSTVTYAAHDSRTMLRRNLRRMARYPSLILFLVGGPIIFLLLFVYVFGETLGAGLGGPSGDRADYVNYVVPGIVVLTVAAAVQGTAISVAMDMYEGIIARFRTMAISRTAVLTGHVVSSLIQTMGSMAVITGVALLVGFRPNATPVEWLAAIGLLALFCLALIWLAAALGLNAKSVETASNAPTILVLLPLLGSGFVPTDSMPTAMRWFAEYQPFTSVIETVRGLLLGTAIGTNGVLAVGWSIGIGLASYLWARHLFNRPPRALSMLATSSARTK